MTKMTYIDDVHEAERTKDCQRQQALAEHPSLIVRTALARNPHLCSSVSEIIKDINKSVEENN